MKLSQYNLYIENRENLIIYNTISNGVLEVEKQYALEIKSYNQGGMQLSRELKDNLIKGSMLVPDNLDEYRMLKVLHLSNVYDNQRVDFTIAPTLKCNFRCSYCYEEGHRYHTMSRIVVDQTIKFIKELSKNKRDLSITWYAH